MIDDMKMLDNLEPNFKNLVIAFGTRYTQIMKKNLIITSGYRSMAWDISKGRSGYGAHTRGLAVDISCVSSWERWQIIKILQDMNIRRIGIYSRHIHFDVDYVLTNPIIYYGEYEGIETLSNLNILTILSLLGMVIIFAVRKKK